MLTHVATIRTKIIPQKNDEGETEFGVYEVEVWSNLMYALGDPKGFINHEIAAHLAQCVKTTGLPLGEQLWHVEFTPWAKAHLNYPMGFTA